MSSAPSVTQWTQLVATQLPPLSRPQATVLALWSLGLVLARSCGLTAVSVFVASLQDRKENTVRQQLREWCYEAPAKRGAQRQALAVETCFAPLLRWVLQWWEGSQLAPGARRHHLGRPVCRAGDQCALPRLRHPGGLGRLARHRQRGLESRVAAPAAAPAGHGARNHDGHRLGRPGAVCPLAVSGHYSPGVASPAARQRRGPVSASRLGPLAAVAYLGARTGHPLAGFRHGLQDPPAGLYLVGLLGTGAGRSGGCW